MSLVLLLVAAAIRVHARNLVQMMIEIEPRTQMGFDERGEVVVMFTRRWRVFGMVEGFRSEAAQSRRHLSASCVLAIKLRLSLMAAVGYLH